MDAHSIKRQQQHRGKDDIKFDFRGRIPVIVEHAYDKHEEYGQKAEKMVQHYRVHKKDVRHHDSEDHADTGPPGSNMAVCATMVRDINESYPRSMSDNQFDKEKRRQENDDKLTYKNYIVQKYS
jgi:hypothetical protein